METVTIFLKFFNTSNFLCEFVLVSVCIMLFFIILVNSTVSLKKEEETQQEQENGKSFYTILIKWNQISNLLPFTGTGFYTEIPIYHITTRLLVNKSVVDFTKSHDCKIIVKNYCKHINFCGYYFLRFLSNGKIGTQRKLIHLFQS